MMNLNESYGSETSKSSDVKLQMRLIMHPTLNDLTVKDIRKWDEDYVEYCEKLWSQDQEAVPMDLWACVSNEVKHLIANLLEVTFEDLTWEEVEDFLNKRRNREKRKIKDVNAKEIFGKLEMTTPKTVEEIDRFEWQYLKRISDQIRQNEIQHLLSVTDENKRFRQECMHHWINGVNPPVIRKEVKDAWVNDGKKWTLGRFTEYLTEEVAIIFKHEVKQKQAAQGNGHSRGQRSRGFNTFQNPGKMPRLSQHSRFPSRPDFQRRGIVPSRPDSRPDFQRRENVPSWSGPSQNPSSRNGQDTRYGPSRNGHQDARHGFSRNGQHSQTSGRSSNAPQRGSHTQQSYTEKWCTICKTSSHNTKDCFAKERRPGHKKRINRLAQTIAKNMLGDNHFEPDDQGNETFDPTMDEYEHHEQHNSEYLDNQEIPYDGHMQETSEYEDYESDFSDNQ